MNKPRRLCLPFRNETDEILLATPIICTPPTTHQLRAQIITVAQVSQNLHILCQPLYTKKCHAEP